MNKTNSGFALVEVLISILIVSFGVLSLVKFQANLHVNQDISAHRTEAQALAMQVVNSIAGSATPSAYDEGTDTVAGKSTTYTRTWAVALDALGNTLVESRAAWTDSRGASDSVQLHTVLIKDGGKQEAKLLASHHGIPTEAGGTTTNPTPWATPSNGGAASSDETSPPAPSDFDTPFVVPENAQTVSGTLYIVGAASISNISISATPDGSCYKASGALPFGYSCVVPTGWTGTVTVTSSDHATVSPVSRTYTNVSAPRQGQNYTISK